MTHTHEAMRVAAESRQDRNVGDLRSMLRQCLGELEKYVGRVSASVTHEIAQNNEIADLRAQFKRVMDERDEQTGFAETAQAKLATAEAEATRLGKLGLSQYHGELQEAQAENTRLRTALEDIIEDLTNEDHRSGDWSEQVVIRNARIALEPETGEGSGELDQKGGLEEVVKSGDLGKEWLAYGLAMGFAIGFFVAMVIYA